MQHPLITIITISYNNKEGLEKTLASVTSQSYQEFEYVVIDGGSQDGSKEVLERYSDKITYWVSEPDKGIYNAMNKGIKAATGEYLLFLNSGDEFFNESALDGAKSHLGKEEIVYGNLEIVDDTNRYNKEYNQELSFHYFYTESLPHPSSFIKRTAFDKYGLYNESLKIISDWKWFLEAIIIKKATYNHIPETISRFYLDGISSNNQEKVQKEKDEVFATYPFLREDAQKIEELRSQIKGLKDTEYQYNRLKKYRVVRLLNQLGIIKFK